MLTVTEALKTPIIGLNVMVIGLPASGKTFFAGWLSLNNPAHKLYRTDDYLQGFGGEKAMYATLFDVTGSILIGQKTIVEGVAGYRMLRKGVQLETYFPDIVFELVAPTEQRERVYQQERKDKSFSNVERFDKALTTVLNDYNELIENYPLRSPTWIRVQNEYVGFM
jgi:hypothetical protein